MFDLEALEAPPLNSSTTSFLHQQEQQQQQQQENEQQGPNPEVVNPESFSVQKPGSIASFSLPQVSEELSAENTESLSSSKDLPSCGSPKQKNSSRRNAWGNLSYADLITQAIQSAPEQRLTLSQIYEWVVKNVPYFKDKGDSASSSGWKVCSMYLLSNLVLEHQSRTFSMQHHSWHWHSKEDSVFSYRVLQCNINHPKFRKELPIRIFAPKLAQIVKVHRLINCKMSHFQRVRF